MLFAAVARRCASRLPRICVTSVVVLFRNVPENGSHNAPRAARTPSAMGLSGWACCIFTHPRHTTATDTHDSSPQEAIPGLPEHVVVTHILRNDYFDDPADLARLHVVSRAMRDAVAATGLQLQELYEFEAARLGCLSAVWRLQRRGLLTRQEYLYAAAAENGHLEVLQWLHAEGCLFSDAHKCAEVTLGKRLEVLK